LTWSIPENTKPGIYKGSVRVELSENRDKFLQIPVEVTIYDFVLPKQPSLGATYDARLTRSSGAGGLDAFKQKVALMAENRIQPDAIKPDVKVTFQNGQFSFDWTEFDEMATYLFDDLKIRNVYTPNLFYCFGWGHPPKDFFGEKPYSGEWPFKDADRKMLRPEYKKQYQTALREFWNHVTEKGWKDKFVLYISDEPNHWETPIKEQMIALCEMIHEVDPNIPIYCSTWGFVPEWLGSLDVWGIGHYGIVPPETMQQIYNHGSKIWFTTDGMLCLDTPYSAIERLLPHYAFKYGADAYEFWGVDWYTYDPWKYGSHAFIHQSSTPGEYYWVRYPNGDGYLIYPQKNGETGKFCSSVRFEQARDGMEDYEYLLILKNLISEHESKNPNDPNVIEAKKVLKDAADLVYCPTSIGRYSTYILPDPHKLMTIRNKIAKSIESLAF
ncbi:MAG: DUF4091 domain-containing protein, partial [Thermoguttaceae bacterium]